MLPKYARREKSATGMNLQRRADSLLAFGVTALAAKFEVVSLFLAVLAAVLAPLTALLDRAATGRMCALVCHHNLPCAI
jgi:hypothetical protein